MIKVKTFTNELKIYHTMEELDALDSQVNQFIQDNSITKVISVSDTCTAGGEGTVGIIRVVAYEES